MTGDIGQEAFYNCYRLGESNPEKTVIFADTQVFDNVKTWDAVGTSGGRVQVTVDKNRLKFANGTSGIPKPE